MLVFHSQPWTLVSYQMLRDNCLVKVALAVWCWGKWISEVLRLAGLMWNVLFQLTLGREG